MHCSVFHLQKVNFTHKDSKFCQNNFDEDTTMAAEETVAFSLKHVYLLKPGCVPAFILRQHFLSQESHYGLRKLEKVQ